MHFQAGCNACESGPIIELPSGASPGVKRRDLKLLALLLPLFVVRSFVPTGFMLSLDGGMLSLVFCPSQISLPSVLGNDGAHETYLAHDHEGADHGHHGGDEADSSSAHQDQQTCPFAFAAAAPLGIAQNFALEPPHSEAISGPPDSAIRSAVSRAHPIRGPPSLS